MIRCHHNSISIIDIRLEGTTPGGLDEDDMESVRLQLEQRIKQESERYKEQAEANEKLQLKLIELQRESEQLQKDNQEREQSQR